MIKGKKKKKNRRTLHLGSKPFRNNNEQGWWVSLKKRSNSSIFKKCNWIEMTGPISDKSFFFILHNLEPPETDLICHFRTRFQCLLVRCRNVFIRLPAAGWRGNRGGGRKDSDGHVVTQQAPRWWLATGVFARSASQMNSEGPRVTNLSF